MFAQFECKSLSLHLHTHSPLHTRAACVTLSLSFSFCSLNLYFQLFLPSSSTSPVFLIAKSMLRVREQGVSGYPPPPLPRNLCMCVDKCVFVCVLVCVHADTHPSICPISTCAEAQPPGKLTNESLPPPSVTFLSAFSSFPLLHSSIPHRQLSSHHAERLSLFPGALHLVWLQFGYRSKDESRICSGVDRSRALAPAWTPSSHSLFSYWEEDVCIWRRAGLLQLVVAFSPGNVFNPHFIFTKSCYSQQQF